MIRILALVAILAALSGCPLIEDTRVPNDAGRDARVDTRP